MTEVLPHDDRVDVARAGVVGRSYGGYMTLTLAARHPELWRGAVDMFGPYDLLTFMDRIPETWKPYFALAVGDPTTDGDFLVERSPRTYVDDLACPLLVIQGRNDPRVVERESSDLVEQLRGRGSRRRLPRVRGRGPRRAQAREPRALLRTDRRRSSPSICPSSRVGSDRALAVRPRRRVRPPRSRLRRRRSNSAATSETTAADTTPRRRRPPRRRPARRRRAARRRTRRISRPSSATRTVSRSRASARRWRRRSPHERRVGRHR